jgi:hypothetical protein
MSELNLQEIFDANITTQGKNGTILALANAGLDVTVAVREYNKMAREAGLILGAKERAERVIARLDADQPDLVVADTRAEYAEQFADEFDISPATAMQHIRDYCELRNIVLPTLQRTPFKEVIAFIQTARDNGEERAETVKRIAETFGMAENSAASAYSNALRELGLTTGRAGPKVGVADLVMAIRSVKDLPKAEAIKSVCDATGYSEATMKQTFSFIPFAEEWAKQESENKKKKAA